MRLQEPRDLDAGGRGQGVEDEPVRLARDDRFRLRDVLLFGVLVVELPQLDAERLGDAALEPVAVDDPRVGLGLAEVRDDQIGTRMAIGHGAIGERQHDGRRDEGLQDRLVHSRLRCGAGAHTWRAHVLVNSRQVSSLRLGAEI